MLVYLSFAIFVKSMNEALMEDHSELYDLGKKLSSAWFGRLAPTGQVWTQFSLRLEWVKHVACPWRLCVTPLVKAVASKSQLIHSLIFIKSPNAKNVFRSHKQDYYGSHSSGCNLLPILYEPWMLVFKSVQFATGTGLRKANGLFLNPISFEIKYV